MICDRCHVGQMLAYERKVGPDGKATIRGTKCSVCGYVALDSDDDVWSAVGL